jgi:dTMP kinase
MRQGHFISFEGIEGAGKSTVVHALEQELSGRGIDVLVTREPGGTPLAEALRELLLRPDTERISPTAETLMMFAARALHVDNRIRPALEAGRWVLCDRFTDASYAYQGWARGVPGEFIGQLAQAVHGGLWPERTLLFDLPVDVGLERARSRAGAPDRFETERREFFEGVRAAYLERARAEPARIRVLDATQPAHRVLDAALAALADLLPAEASP